LRAHSKPDSAARLGGGPHTKSDRRAPRRPAAATPCTRRLRSHSAIRLPTSLRQRRRRCGREPKPARLGSGWQVATSGAPYTTLWRASPCCWELCVSKKISQPARRRARVSYAAPRRACRAQGTGLPAAHFLSARCNPVLKQHERHGERCRVMSACCCSTVDTDLSLQN
jgi:hypothetical protein